MQNINRLNVDSVIAELKQGQEVNIGAAMRADRVRLRRHCVKAGFRVTVAKVGIGYIASATGAI